MSDQPFTQTRYVGNVLLFSYLQYVRKMSNFPRSLSLSALEPSTLFLVELVSVLLFSFSPILHYCSHVQSLIFSVSLCRIIFLLIQNSSLSVMRLSNIYWYIRVLILHKCLVFFFLLSPMKFSSLLILCTSETFLFLAIPIRLLSKSCMITPLVRQRTSAYDN